MESSTATSPPATGNGQRAGGRFDVANPATGERLTTVAVASPERVAEVVARLRESQAEWEAIGIRGRREWLGRLRDWLLDNADAVADTLQAETGKVRAEAVGEVPYIADAINFWGANAKKWIGEQKVTPHMPLRLTKKLRVRYRPFPVVGVISPWNFPLILSFGDAMPALQAGGAVVIKPSELTPLAVQMVVDAWKREIGGPDVLDVVQGMAETGSALVDEVDFVQFTGSDRTGRRVMARAAETLTPVSLELGGKDPLIVLDDADVERAANAAAWGGFVNAGQVCMSVERIYVEEPVYDRFVERFTEEVSSLRQGSDPDEPAAEVGAMTSPAQLDVIEDHVADALERGASAVIGGSRKPGPGDWFEPTVLVDVDHSMKVMRDETFGPVVGIMKVRDEEEAVRLANDTRYGLSANVFGSPRRAERVARRMECGAVNVNDALTNFLTTDIPMGGWKTSGIGFRHGEQGIRKFVRPESIVSARVRPKRELLWYPYDRKRLGQVLAISRFFSARDWRRRLGRR